MPEGPSIVILKEEVQRFTGQPVLAVEGNAKVELEFLQWKKEHVLKAHWPAHTKPICQRCNLPFIKKHTGLKKRRSFFCPNCQTIYA